MRVSLPSPLSHPPSDLILPPPNSPLQSQQRSSLLPVMPRTNHCSLIGILLRSMACFFRCFGFRSTYPRHLVPSSDEPASSTYQSQVREDAVLKEKDRHLHRASRTDFDDSELQDEANFLKACGTLQETPDEIRKLSRKQKDSVDHDSELKYHSWLPTVSTSELLEKDKLTGQIPAPVRFDEENATEPAEMDSPTPCSCTVNEQSDVHISISYLEDAVADSTITTVNLQVNEKPDATNISISPGPTACKSEFLNRSVRFASQLFTSESSPQTCIQNREKPELKDHGSLIKHSPYPTPLTLTDDMQTPGTVFASGNNARVRSQYVYSSVNVSQIMDHSSIIQGGVSLGPPQNVGCNSKLSQIGTSIRGDLNMGTDLSSWLKSPAFDRLDSERKSKPGGNQGDRPIIGLVPQHWKEEEEVSHISPKEWDGNGIPNTTTKYKEDQKVRWHATPFEERLEKALSEECFIPQRKPVITEAVVFEDDKDRDTVPCKLQSLKLPKPLDSY